MAAKQEVRIVRRNGKRFAEVPLAEYRRLVRLAEAQLPPLPKADERGNRPAVEYTTVALARRIIRRRLKAGLTQAALAARAGVRAETISRLEAAKHVPNLATIEKIDRALTQAQRQAGKAKPRTGTARRKR